MTRTRVILLVSSVVALAMALLGIAGCSPKGSSCEYDRDCVEGLHCCNRRCHECCGVFDCGPGEDCDDYECVVRAEPPTALEPEPKAEPTDTPGPPTPMPLPELEPVLRFILGEFEENYNAAFESSDVESVVDLLHPVVVDLYGPAACSDYVQEVVVNPVQIEIIDATEIGSWTWVIDERSIPVRNAYEVDVDFTVQGETTGQVIHLALREDGSLGWFADCGDPLPSAPPPLPPPSEAASLTDPPGDPINCTDGSSIAVPEVFWPDIVEVNAEGNTFYIKFAEELTEETWTGICFNFTGQPLMRISPTFLDKAGNLNVMAMFFPPDIIQTDITYFDGDQWQVSNLVPDGGVDGNTVWITVPPGLESEHPGFWPITGVKAGAVATDGKFIRCDRAGIGEDGLPWWEH